MHKKEPSVSLSRRQLLCGLAAAAAGMPGLPAAAASWSNWSGNQQARSSGIADEGQLVEAIRAVRSVRAVGGGHSFSPVVGTDGSIISLEALNGLVRHGPAHRYHRPLFAAVEPVFPRYGGRPHWGKLHSLRAAACASSTRAGTISCACVPRSIRGASSSMRACAGSSGSPFDMKLPGPDTLTLPRAVRN